GLAAEPPPSSNARAPLPAAGFDELPPVSRPGTALPDRARWNALAADAAAFAALPEACVGTGYGRQTLPFDPAAVRSEILCHGRGAHHFFPGTRTVLDIGGPDTQAPPVRPNPGVAPVPTHA